MVDMAEIILYELSCCFDLFPSCSCISGACVHGYNTINLSEAVSLLMKSRFVKMFAVGNHVVLEYLQ